MMRRREFVTLLGGAAAWSIASNAQPTERTRVVGVLEILGPDDPETKTRSEVFARTLQQLGWAVGRDLKIETRNVGGDRDHLRRYAAELIALTPDVIVSVGSVTVAPLQQATRTIPIVFVNVPDPIGAGFVQSMAHPGGNITGFLNFEYSMSEKWAELLYKISLHDTRPIVFHDPAPSLATGPVGPIISGRLSLGIELTPLNVRDTDEIERNVEAFARSGNGGVIVT